MKIAVTALGRELDSEVDPRFGRARYILILDKAGSLLEVVDNSAGINAMKGAGIQAGKALADRRVDVLLTGHCGPNAFKTLKAAKIRIALTQNGTVRQALERFNRNEVNYAQEPDVQGGL